MAEYPLSLAVCDWWIHNVCFPLACQTSGGAGGGISEHCTDMRVVLEGAHFFPWQEGGRVLIELRGSLCVIGQTNNQNVTERKNKNNNNKKNGETCRAHGEWRSADKRCGLLHHLKVGGRRGGLHQSTADEIHKAMENKYSRSSAAWLLISYLPWQCKNDAVSKIKNKKKQKTSEGVNWMRSVSPGLLTTSGSHFPASASTKMSEGITRSEMAYVYSSITSVCLSNHEQVWNKQHN